MKEKEKIIFQQAREVTTQQAKDILKLNMELIQNNISSIMAAKKISQSELARAIESEPNHVNYILRKKNKGITIKVLGRIAVALNVKLTDLVKSNTNNFKT